MNHIGESREGGEVTVVATPFLLNFEKKEELYI